MFSVGCLCRRSRSTMVPVGWVAQPWTWPLFLSSSRTAWRERERELSSEKVDKTKKAISATRKDFFGKPNMIMQLGSQHRWDLQAGRACMQDSKGHLIRSFSMLPNDHAEKYRWPWQRTFNRFFARKMPNPRPTPRCFDVNLTYPRELLTLKPSNFSCQRRSRHKFPGCKYQCHWAWRLSFWRKSLHHRGRKPSLLHLDQGEHRPSARWNHMHTLMNHCTCCRWSWWSRQIPVWLELSCHVAV